MSQEDLYTIPIETSVEKTIADTDIKINNEIEIKQNNIENISINETNVVTVHESEESKLDDNEELSDESDTDTSKESNIKGLTPEMLKDLERNVAYLNEMILKEELKEQASISNSNSNLYEINKAKRQVSYRCDSELFSQYEQMVKEDHVK